MKLAIIVTIVLNAMCIAGADAAMNKCLINGKTSYQQAACPKASEVGAITGGTVSGVDQVSSSTPALKTSKRVARGAVGGNRNRNDARRQRWADNASGAACTRSFSCYNKGNAPVSKARKGSNAERKARWATESRTFRKCTKSYDCYR